MTRPLLFHAVGVAMQQRAAERERLRKEREERKQKLEQEKLVLLLQAVCSHFLCFQVSSLVIMVIVVMVSK